MQRKGLWNKHKHIKATIFNILTVLLASCSKNNWRTNIFVAGIYEGNDYGTPELLCRLVVEPISVDEYEAAQGKNVIQDQINFEYYSLDFSVILEDGTVNAYDFMNFKSVYSEKNTSIPAVYRDDNDIWIEPQTICYVRPEYLFKRSYHISFGTPIDGIQITVHVKEREGSQ